MQHRAESECSNFRQLERRLEWHGLCRPPPCMKLTTPILMSLCDEITNGNPLWALTVLNEYLTPDDPIHRACVHRAKIRLRQAPQSSPLVEQLIGGATYEQLPPELQSYVGPKSSPRRRRLPSFQPRVLNRRRGRSSLNRRNLDSVRLRTRALQLTPQRAPTSRPVSLALDATPRGARTSW